VRAQSRDLAAPAGQQRSQPESQRFCCCRRIAIQVGRPLNLDHMASFATQKAVLDRHAEEQAKEARGLEEILRNQAPPATWWR
jgi:hypothetical protein